MSRRTSAPIAVPITLLAGVLALGIGLAGCAQLGMGGPAKQTRREQGPNRPTRTIDPRDQSATPAPPRTLPIPGQSPNPTATAPPGALPDPYANPPR